MLVFAGGSEGNGRIQSDEFLLKVHDSERLASTPRGQMGKSLSIMVRESYGRNLYLKDRRIKAVT